jgi:histidinol-phosphate aminotransferase
MLKCVDDRTRLVFLANPGNPTGTWIPFSEIERLHRALPPSVILVLDGAYGEFVTDPGFNDGLELARRSENVVVTHTFSKLHGLAGLRVGWGYAPMGVVEAGGLKLCLLAGFYQGDDPRLARAPGRLSGVIGAAPAPLDV